MSCCFHIKNWLWNERPYCEFRKLAREDMFMGEVYDFPKCMRYSEYYHIFCRVFNLAENREKIQMLKDGIVIEIRNKENGHNVPHIHASYQGENISISLIDGEILAGNIPKRNQKIAVQWVVENLDMLRKEWENRHGIIKFPDMNTKVSSSLDS